MKKLFIGPFVGDFTHELYAWQSFARFKAKDYDHVVVSTKPIYEFLYKDFANKFDGFDLGVYNSDLYKIINMTELMEQEIFDRIQWYKNDGYDIMTPNLSNNILKTSNQEFIKYGSTIKGNGYDVIMHARNFNIPNSEDKKIKDWDIYKWSMLVRKLVNNGYSVASIGLSGYATHIERTNNLLDINLENLTNILYNAKCIVGPSSGPLHLASLCGCPQIVWSEKQNKNRYLKEWNPFQTEVKFYSEEGWDPIFENIEKLIEEVI